jgi:ATP-dependent 26S proteasome regulatory subunit
MTIGLGPAGDLVRVRWIDDDHRRVFIEVRNGQTATVNTTDPVDWDVGTVLLITRTGESPAFDTVPAELWPEESWVGVVRVHLPDVLVVDTSGRLRLVPRSGIDCKVGNTVEVRDTTGVVRVLSENPIRYLDLPEIDDTVVDRFTSSRSGLTFADFGGFETVKARAQDLVVTPLLHRATLQAIGVRPVKGVLFTGPPGSGKTMLARIIANVADAEFYEISGPEIFSKWYGESEKLLRAIFDRAAKQRQSIVFLDEIDSIAGQRSGDAHEASKRVVGQLLALMDGFDAKQNVVVIAATNRPQDVDVALRRPGRFDWEIALPLPNQQDREAILRVSAGHLTTSGHLPHDAIAAQTETWSGAELVAIWSEAALLAIADGRMAIMVEDYFGGYTRVDANRRQANTIVTEANS